MTFKKLLSGIYHKGNAKDSKHNKKTLGKTQQEMLYNEKNSLQLIPNCPVCTDWCIILLLKKKKG